MTQHRRTIEGQLAEKMGYQYCILFPRGRDALGAYSAHADVVLPSNICPEISDYASKIVEIDDYGQGGCAQLYGYYRNHGYELNLDPLMTGWVKPPLSEHSIISFGRYKMTETYGGGALLTNDTDLYAKHMEEYMPPGLLEPIGRAICNMDGVLRKRWEAMEEWDQELGNLLIRIPREYVMPWRCMRMCPPTHRNAMVAALRMDGVAVSTNYPPLPGQPPNNWGDNVIGFPLNQSPAYVAACIYAHYDRVYSDDK